MLLFMPMNLAIGVAYFFWNQVLNFIWTGDSIFCEHMSGNIYIIDLNFYFSVDDVYIESRSN